MQHNHVTRHTLLFRPRGCCLFDACLVHQGPDGRPLMLGPGRHLYSSSNPTPINASAPQGSKNATPGTAVAITAALAGSAAKTLYTRVRGAPEYTHTPSWSVTKMGQVPAGMTNEDGTSVGQVRCSRVLVCTFYCC
jgi:hypothetical protein